MDTPKPNSRFGIVINLSVNKRFPEKTANFGRSQEKEVENCYRENFANDFLVGRDSTCLLGTEQCNI